MISSDFSVLSKRNIPYKAFNYYNKDITYIIMVVYVIGYNSILLPTKFTKEYWSLELASRTVFKKDYV